MFHPIRRLLALLLLPALARAEPFPLRDLALREAIPLESWRFLAVPSGQEEDFDGSGDMDRADWQEIRVPAVWEYPPGSVPDSVRGQVAWYHTSIDLPAAWDGEVELCFLGVQFIADVFVNGEYSAVHRGGYTPFRVSVGHAAQLPPRLDITLRVDNRLGDEAVPKIGVGWELYGGITREAYVLHRPPARPENLHVRSRRVDADTWALRVDAESVGEPEMPMYVRLLRGEVPVAEKELPDWFQSLSVELAVHKPALWSPEEPNLYRLELSWGGERLAFPVGLREIAYRNGRLLLNGEPIWLQGFGQHEYWPESGPILNNAQRRGDLERMKAVFGANALRTGHYPNHPDLFNLADELGLLVFTEIPVWQNPARWLARDDAWQDWLDPQITGMILALRNHPSVFAWGVLNESGGAHAYIRRARARIRDMDPDRAVAAVLDREHDFAVNRITDLAARNLHYGWYHSDSVYALRAALASNLAAAGDTPLWISEMGGMARPGRLGGGYSDDVRGTETYQEKMTRFGLQYAMAHADRLVGISLWTWSDFSRNGRPHHHGILGPDRAPKLTAYAVANLMFPPLAVLALENETVIPLGDTFQADFAVFARRPEPGRKLTVAWRIQRGAVVVAQGESTGDLGESLATPFGKMAWPVTGLEEAGLHHLYVELRDGGKRLHGQALPIEAVETTNPGVLRLAPPKDGGLRTVAVNGMTLDVYPHVGLLLALPPGTHTLEGPGGKKDFAIAAARSTVLPWE